MSFFPLFNVFTHIMLIANVCGLCVGVTSDLWAIATCWNAGVASSFMALSWIDPTACRRKARKHGWPMWLFHFGNWTLHYLPFLFATLYPPSKCKLGHGLVAATVNLAWTRTTIDGNIFLNTTYVALRRYDWCALWTISITAQVAWAICMTVVFDTRS